VQALPIRLRLTLAFSVVMAVVLAGAGFLVYARLDDSLTASMDRDLRARADQYARQPGRPGPRFGPRRGPPEAAPLQLLDADGGVVESAFGGITEPILSADQVREAARGSLFADAKVAGVGLRVLAVPAADEEEAGSVAVFAQSTRERGQALSGLRSQLLLGGLLALGLVSLGGYGLAALALRPVERMRRRAATISGAGDGSRLPVQAGRDEISRLGSTFNDLIARMEATVARERAFVADASHELRTPLSIIKGELELVADAGATAAEIRASARSASEEADRLGQLAEDLLILARADQGRLALRLAPVSTGALLERTARRYARRVADGGRTLGIAPGPVHVVVADELRLEQALGNLVENALRHGGGPIEIWSREGPEGTSLGVRDRGPGFPEAFLAEAFDRFARADAGRGDGGSGLGLAIVRTIARGHGGEARVANRAGGGAEAWLELPAPSPARPVAAVA
jgi:signal transduction histidine kinase